MYSEKLIDTVDTQVLIPQSEYVKKLKPLLPPEAFKPDNRKLLILFFHLGVLIFGWGIAAQLEQWPMYLLGFYLPLALMMGNSITTLLFVTHELMHGGVIKKSRLSYFISFLGWVMLLMPPTQWKTLHNLVHHNTTNSLEDPDRNYLQEQPETCGKRIHKFLLTSVEINPVLFAIGMPCSWAIHNFRNLSSVLFFNSKSVNYVPAAFTFSKTDRLIIAFECLAILTIHLSLLAYLEFDPLKITLAYLIPIAVGHAGAMFYIETNHLLCRMTSVNDPLINTVSLRVPKIFDWLHLNFSYHTEHHIFPSLNSDYYPLVQELIEIHYPGRMNLVSAGEAWRLLLGTPRYYKDELTLTDYSGEISVSCPFNR